MRALKKILIGLGSIFLVLIALFTWLGLQSVRFKQQQEPFVRTYMTDLSRHWNVADVYDRSDNEFLAEAGSAPGVRTMQSFKSLGPLLSIHDLELKNFSDGTWGRRGVFAFKGRFQNGEALVQILLENKGRTGSRVFGVNLSAIQLTARVTGGLTT
jgi:hypothetical protein